MLITEKGRLKISTPEMWMGGRATAQFCPREDQLHYFLSGEDSGAPLMVYVGHGHGMFEIEK